MLEILFISGNKYFEGLWISFYCFFFSESNGIIFIEWIFFMFSIVLSCLFEISTMELFCACSSNWKFIGYVKKIYTPLIFEVLIM